MTDWTETELSALRRAYASGTTRVSYDGKSVDYGSAEDLLARTRYEVDRAPRKVAAQETVQREQERAFDPPVSRPTTNTPMLGR